MAKAPEPIVLELATLSREQMGPYLLLGLDKSADKEQIDKHWADRVKWALRSRRSVRLRAKCELGRTKYSRRSTAVSVPM